MDPAGVLQGSIRTTDAGILLAFPPAGFDGAHVE
jgi:hypothetical protein